MASSTGSQTRPKPGTKPGTRGARTRATLMQAARDMLKTASPIELTAIAVSRAAGTAPPSFYVYFADARDLLLALADEASTALTDLRRHFDPPHWPAEDAETWAGQFVAGFVETWQSQCEVLAIRNLEADRGDIAFDELRVDSALPVLNGLTDLMMASRPDGTRRVEAFSEAVIFYAILERIATVENSTRPHRLQPHHYKAGIARMIGKAVAKPA